MLFSSIPFLYYFLPAVLTVYFLAPRKLKNAVLLLSSLVFYGWGEPKLLFLMVFTIALFFFCGLAIARWENRKKLWLTVSVVISLGLLGVFKYADFFIDSFNRVTGLSVPFLRLALPVGISFYTFQCLSYTIDVYRGNVPAQRNPVAFGAYVALFPQLIAGPIVRYADIARELENRKTDWEDVYYGLRRFLVGLSKKVLLADSFALLTKLYRESAEPSVLFAWLYAVAFAFQIYFDFSGYSDMAIGLGRAFGFRFDENFNYPYMASSVTDFWRRWHISMTSWFREYLYIPLGGNRGGTAKALRNIFIVWLATGIWHGASWNFIVWGLYFAVLLVMEKYLLRGLLARTPKVIKHIYTLLLVMIGWGIFAIEDLGLCFGYLRTCFGGAELWSAANGYDLRSYAISLVILTVASTTLGRTVWNRLSIKAQQVAMPLLMAGSLLVGTAYLVSGSYNPFLYFRF